MRKAPSNEGVKSAAYQVTRTRVPLPRPPGRALVPFPQIQLFSSCSSNPPNDKHINRLLTNEGLLCVFFDHLGSKCEGGGGAVKVNLCYRNTPVSRQMPILKRRDTSLKTCIKVRCVVPPIR